MIESGLGTHKEKGSAFTLLLGSLGVNMQAEGALTLAGCCWGLVEEQTQVPLLLLPLQQVLAEALLAQAGPVRLCVFALVH